MFSSDFAYWLQGYFELTDSPQTLSVKQVEVIKNHLNLVFRHEIDPSYLGDPQELQDIHDGITKIKPQPWTDGQVKPNSTTPVYHPTSDPLIRC